MSFLSRLFFRKPKPSSSSLDSKDRLKALDRGSVIGSALNDLAGSDTNIDVRKSALSQLGDPAQLLQFLATETDTGLKSLIRGKLKALLILPEHATTLQKNLPNLDSELLEHVAIAAKLPEQRKGALVKITRVGFLGDRALADTDSSIRLSLIDRIDSDSTLERIAKQSRTKDKALYRLAKAKLDASKLAAGDSATIAQHAEALCIALELLTRRQPFDTKNQLQALDEEMAKLERASTVPAIWTGRFNRAKATLTDMLAPKPIAVEPVIEPTALASADIVVAPEVIQAADSVEPNAVEPNAAEQGAAEPNAADQGAAEQGAAAPEAALVDKAASAPIVRARAKPAELSAAQKASVEALVQHVKTLQKLVDAGDLKPARALEIQIDALLKESAVKHAASAEIAQLGDIKAALAKLLAWQRWSTGNSRRTMCEEIEALPALALHPDALASKIKEAQQRWLALDQIEGLSTEEAKALGIGKRFRALCYQALAPAKGFFEKRSEVREQKHEVLSALLERADSTLKTDGISAADLMNLRADLSGRLRNLDELEPAARKSSSQRIRDLNEAINAKIDAHFGEAEAVKRKLIAHLRRDLIGAKSIAALGAAKVAQQAWKTLPRGKRAVEDELWKELRSLVDPLFEAQKSADEQRRTSEDAVVSARQAVIDETKALAQSALAQGGSEVLLQALEERWKALTEPDEPADKTELGGRGSRTAGGRDAGRDSGRDLGRDSGRDSGRDFGGRDSGGKDARGKPMRESRSDEALRAQQRDFDTAISSVQQSKLQRESAGGEAKLMQERELSAFCLSAENAWLSGAEFSESWPENARHKALQARFGRALAGIAAQSPPELTLLAQIEREAESLALALEYLQSRESPDAFKAERMQYQIMRLNQKLSQGQPETSAQEISRLQQQWRALGPLRPEIRSHLQLRIEG